MPCKYCLPFPDEIIHCEAYSHAKYKNGISWLHFPICDSSNCPIKHPELLNGGVLVDEKEIDIDG